MRRVELGGTLSHACVECGKWCKPPCLHDSAVPERCVPCSAPYVDNPPAEDGRVYCRGGCTDAPFPDTLPPGVDKYPAYCKQCREDRAVRRAEAAEYREYDATVGVGAVVKNGTPPPAPDPLADRPRGRPSGSPNRTRAAAPTESKWSRGGFEPRAIKAGREPSEMGG